MGKNILLGKHLKDARLKRGWKIPSLSKELCISKSYLKALEADDKDSLPKPTFAIGFLRTYATHLGLDANGLVQTAKGFYGQTVVPQEASAPETAKESKISGRPLFFTIFGVMVSLYGVWAMLYGNSELRAELTPPVPDHLANLIADEYKNPTGLIIEEQKAETIEAKTETLQKKITPSELPETMNFNSVEETNRDADQSISEIVLSADLQNNQTLSLMEIKADRDTWVLIKTASNKILMEGILKSGTGFQSPEGEDLLLTTGDAGAITVSLGGKSSDPLGGNGIVLKDVDLSKYKEALEAPLSSH